MCYVLYVASPLTLSEIRSMLPAGITADALAPDAGRALRRHFRPARTAARLLIGPCSCDLLLDRDRAGHQEEAELRRRYSALGLTRVATIRALDAHRVAASDEPVRTAAHWRRALAGFVAEHARNAGPSFYWLRFAKGDVAEPPPAPGPATSLSAADVVANPDGWLGEDRPVIVGR